MIARRSAIRLAAYFSVGFVLIFFGKISKAELFHNYFKSISDVGGRNSQDISLVPEAQYMEMQAAEVQAPVFPRATFAIFLQCINPFSDRLENEDFQVQKNEYHPGGFEIFFWSRPSMAP